MILCGCCGAEFGLLRNGANDVHRCPSASVKQAAAEVEAAMPAFILVIGRRPWLAPVAAKIKAKRRAS